MSASPHRTLPRLLTAALGLLASLSAQQLQWDIPARGAHVFTRTVQQFEVAPPQSRATPDWVIGSGEDPEPHAWRYFACPRHGVPAGTWWPHEVRTDDKGEEWAKRLHGVCYVVDDFGFLTRADGKGGAA